MTIKDLKELIKDKDDTDVLMVLKNGKLVVFNKQKYDELKNKINK